MHISFTAHNTSKSTSSFGLVDYLDKENQAYIKEEENGEIHKNMLEKEHEFENFFNGQYSELNTEQKITIDKVVKNIDENRGTQNLKQSNFYMLNISPGKEELRHMENLANLELKKRGLMIESKDKLLNRIYHEQKNELMKIQLKLYTKDLMNEYAKNFNREIYVDETKLPDRTQKKELDNLTEKVFNTYLQEKGIELKEEKQTEKSTKWVESENLKILETKGKSLRAKLTINGEIKSEIFLPKSLVKEQENGTYKLPENLYKQKEQEVLDKNTLVEVNGKLTDIKELKSKEKVYNFEVKDQRFKEALKVSYKETDIVELNGKNYVSKHLLDTKEKESLSKVILSEHGAVRDEIYKNIATKKGYNLEKRALTGDDLLWYGKVESQRTHKPTDKYVLKNNEILKEIKALEKNQFLNSGKIEKLQATLYKDGGKVIQAGMEKDGLQYHAHVIVSRHDRTMQKPENKISLSPLANHKQGKMFKGADVGFNRDNFFEKAEKLFDKKFEYERPDKQKYQTYKAQKGLVSGVKNIQGKAKGEIKSVLMKHTGIGAIKNEISPIQSIKKELGIASIPSRIPKTALDLAYKVGKKIIEKGLSY